MWSADLFIPASWKETLYNKGGWLLNYTVSTWTLIQNFKCHAHKFKECNWDDQNMVKVTQTFFTCIRFMQLLPWEIGFLECRFQLYMGCIYRQNSHTTVATSTEKLRILQASVTRGNCYWNRTKGPQLISETNPYTWWVVEAVYWHKNCICLCVCGNESVHV